MRRCDLQPPVNRNGWRGAITSAELIRRGDAQRDPFRAREREVKGFIVLPKRWIVDRTFGWVNRARRLAKDFETQIASSQAWFMLSLAFLLIRRITRDYATAA